MQIKDVPQILFNKIQVVVTMTRNAGVIMTNEMICEKQLQNSIESSSSTTSAVTVTVPSPALTPSPSIFLNINNKNKIYKKQSKFCMYCNKWGHTNSKCNTQHYEQHDDYNSRCGCKSKRQRMNKIERDE